MASARVESAKADLFDRLWFFRADWCRLRRFASTERQICLCDSTVGRREEWTETIEFKPNGICCYGHPPMVAECKWSRHGNTITISRNGALLNALQYDGKQLVDPQTAQVRGPHVRQK
jgi:hypothetical protein